MVILICFPQSVRLYYRPRTNEANPGPSLQRWRVQLLLWSVKYRLVLELYLHHVNIFCVCVGYRIESVQDFLIKLDMKPCTYASIGNKHFFTQSCKCQTFQNCEQSQQKLETYLENKVLQN